MGKRIVFLPEVAEEIETARDWYAKSSSELAERFLGVLDLTLRSIQARPEHAGFHDERRLYRARRVKAFPYQVVYRDYPDSILIVAMYHTSRHPDGWKDRLL
ncbi:MAG: type II toxin-antitoxin system RelE/ParE family toxin [Planctomycetota bacterium]